MNRNTTKRNNKFQKIKFYIKHTINFQFDRQLNKTLRLFDKASFAYILASMGLYGPLESHLQKKVCKKITLNCHNFYIVKFYFSLPLPHMLHAIATISLHKLPNTNMDNTTSILPQVHVNIKNSPVFFILSKLHLLLLFSGKSVILLLSAHLQHIFCYPLYNF